MVVIIGRLSRLFSVMHTANRLNGRLCLSRAEMEELRDLLNAALQEIEDN